MELMVTISVRLPLSQARQFMETLPVEPASSAPREQPENPPSVASEAAITFERGESIPMKYFIDDNLLKILRFVTAKRGEFLNEDLATQMGVDAQQTFTYLGRITKVLRKAGIRADGARGLNWYRKTRTKNGTLITVRPDVLGVFRTLRH